MEKSEIRTNNEVRTKLFSVINNAVDIARLYIALINKRLHSYMDCILPIFSTIDNLHIVVLQHLPHCAWSFL